MWLWLFFQCKNVIRQNSGQICKKRILILVIYTSDQKVLNLLFAESWEQWIHPICWICVVFKKHANSVNTDAGEMESKRTTMTKITYPLDEIYTFVWSAQFAEKYWIHILRSGPKKFLPQNIFVLDFQRMPVDIILKVIKGQVYRICE